MSERSSGVKHLVKNHPNRPDVHLWADLRAVFFVSLRRQVPVSSDALGREVNPGLFSSHGLAQAKVKNLHQSIMEHDIGGFKIVMNDFLFQSGQVMQGRKDLPYYLFGLFLFKTGVFFEVVRKLRPGAVVKCEDNLFMGAFEEFDKLGDVGVVELSVLFGLALDELKELVLVIGFACENIDFDGDGLVVF